MKGKNTMNTKILLCLWIFSAAALLHAYKQPKYENLRWTDENTKTQIRGPKNSACGVRTSPKRNDLLVANFEGNTIEIDTREFYKLPDQKKEVIIGLYGIMPDDGVRLKEGESHGKQWNCFRLKIKGTPGSKIAMIFIGKRDKKYNRGSYREEKHFTLDGTEQTLEFKKEFPADLKSFALRLDLKTAGVFRFSAPEFFIEDCK